jgi:glycosyltransferase involved in cell wall biosynthesis
MKPFRILMTADPYLPVPPRLYGGIERVIDLLLRGLVAGGHSITLIAHPDSQPPVGVEVVPYGVPPHVGAWPRVAEVAQAAFALITRARHFDLVHSWGRLMALLPVLPLRRLPKIQTYQRDRIPWSSVSHAVRMAGPSVRFVGCSESVYRERPPGPLGGEWTRIFNAVDTERFRARTEVAADAPLMFLGRLERMKGVHHAVEIARRSERRLVIAGNRVDADDGYFESEIAPHLDGHHVEWVGPVDDQAKDHWLGQSAALLMPVEWEEPFGIVMAEALACGTPVVGFPRGGVREVVRDGHNGWLCADVDSAVAAVARLDRIDRRAVRSDCELRFSGTALVDAHLDLYGEMLERTR